MRASKIFTSTLAALAVVLVPGTSPAAAGLAFDPSFGPRSGDLHPNLSGKKGPRDAPPPAVFPDGSMLFPISNRDYRAGRSVGFSKYTRSGKLDKRFGENGTTFVRFDKYTVASAEDAQPLPGGGALLSGRAHSFNVTEVGAFALKVDALGRPDPTFNAGQPLLFPREYNDQGARVWAAPSGAVYSASSGYDSATKTRRLEIRRGNFTGIDGTFGLNGVQVFSFAERAGISASEVRDTSLTFSAVERLVVGGIGFNRCALIELTEDGNSLAVNARAKPNELLHVPTPEGRSAYCGQIRHDGDDWIMVGRPSGTYKPKNAYLVKFRSDGSVASEFGLNGFAFLPLYPAHPRKGVEINPTAVAKLRDGSFVIGASTQELDAGRRPSFFVRIGADGQVIREPDGKWRFELRKNVSSPRSMVPHEDGALVGVLTGFYRDTYRRIELD